ncbi:unknown [Haloarcula marismortui ATCC 43049]|uniref:Signal peptidase I n=3 Tax=Haloarcula TaxID=2237 RepID=Q5UWJ3_HALMA|nr:unknown [Haloarcula marismortui ATCC 43049]
MDMVPIGVLATPLQSSDAGGIVLLLFQLLLAAIQIAGMWMVFKKAGHAGWKAIIPIYNLYIMLRIGENAWWWLLLVFIPVINLYALYKIHAGVARAFGRGIGFGLGLTFLGILFFPLLGFGDYQHRQSGGLA